MVRIVALYSLLGNDSASATAIPPRKPPQVRMGIAPLVNVRHRERTVIGTETATQRAKIVNGIASNATST